MVWPFRSARDRLDDKAAEWASKMRGPNRDRYSDDFQRWYRARPAHAEAYNEAMASFEEAGVLSQSELGRARALPETPRRTVPLRYAFGAAVAAAVVALIFLASAQVPAGFQGGDSRARYATASETREVELADGSRMTLAPETVAVIAFTRSERRITLQRGRGRFSVAHEARPFRVAAGEAEVLAHGTVFEVSLAAGLTRVVLVEGSVDVFYPAAPSERVGREVRRLQPGQHIVVGSPPQAALAIPSADQAEGVTTPRDEPVPAMLQFDDTPLARVLAEANRHSRTRISLADPSISDLRITGTFRAGDAGALAESLAAAFRLRLERRPDGALVLHGALAPPIGDT